MNAFIQLIRPRHWIKNLFLFSAPLFGGVLFRSDVLPPVILAFISFSLCASAVYIFNDVIDKDRDCLHPDKRNRPIACGAVAPNHALGLAIALFIISIGIALPLSPLFLATLLVYAVLQIFYSLCGKNMVFVDLVLIASGFILRMFAGSAASQVTVSLWLFACLFLLSLILATGKRISELSLLHASAVLHRSALSRYSPPMLWTVLNVTSLAAVACYSAYALQHGNMLLTIPFVAAGLFRYRVLVGRVKGEPTEAVLHDSVLRSIVLAWITAILFIQMVLH